MKISLPLNIEIPSNPTDFNLGLMFRESLDQNSGMLFVFEEMGQKSFHMKDTKIPLDIAFVKEDGTIESIKELLPLSVIPISSNGQVLYALEVNRGWFKENNIEVGDNIFESDLASRKKELRLRQIDQQKKWRPNTTSIQRDREKAQMKQEIKQELSQQESVTIENSDGVTFARVMDIVGPAQMKPVVNSDGVWKGTEVVHENAGPGTEDQQQKQIDSKQKKADQIKKQVLLKKLQAVRSGGGSEIMASYDWKSDKSMRINKLTEGSLHKWFKGSKSKDGKGGWVNVTTGGTCASDEPGEGTPKCVSSSKRASMTKAERESASKRKKAADPGQQSKSGAAKPTYVATDKKKKVNEDKVLKTVAKELDGASKMHKSQANKVRKHLKSMKEEKKPKNCGCGQDPCITYGKKKEKVDEACWKGYKAYGMKKKGGKMVPNCKPVGSVKKEEVIVTESDKKGKGSGKKDACYHKVKASAKVWPSAYASGRLVQCRKKGAGNYGKSKSESYSWRDELDFVQEGAAWTKKSGKNKEGGLNEKGRKSYERENPGSDLKAPQPEGGSRKKSFCARMGGMKKKLTSSKTANDPDSRINKALRKWKC